MRATATVTTMMAALLLATGCTHAGARSGLGVPRAIEGDEISYATGACYGTCPVYTVTVRADGTGTFEGVQHTAVNGRRDFTAGVAVYRRLAASLEPYRPDGERSIDMESPDCGMAPTDMPRVDVRWAQASGGSGHLGFYYGCATQNAAIAEALRAVPGMLPIAAFIGKR